MILLALLPHPKGQAFEAKLLTFHKPESLTVAHLKQSVAAALGLPAAPALYQRLEHPRGGYVFAVILEEDAVQMVLGWVGELMDDEDPFKACADEEMNPALWILIEGTAVPQQQQLLQLQPTADISATAAAGLPAAHSFGTPAPMAVAAAAAATATPARLPAAAGSASSAASSSQTPLATSTGKKKVFRAKGGTQAYLQTAYAAVAANMFRIQDATGKILYVTVDADVVFPDGAHPQINQQTLTQGL